MTLFDTSDPFALSGGVEDQFRPSLVERARKRVVRKIPDGSYRVSALGKEYLKWYRVYDGRDGELRCVCWDFDHGEQRAKRKCSHVVAVMLYVEDRGEVCQGEPPSTVAIPLPVNRGDEGSSPCPATMAPGTPVQPPDVIHPALIPSSSRDDFKVNGWPDLPQWVREFRDYQVSAAEEIVEAFNDGISIVYLDAPTGSGKTLVAEMVRRMLAGRGLYICSTKTLQDQFAADYPYASVLKGRKNYPTQTMPFPDYTTADCTKEGAGDEAECYWCPNVRECEYERAKATAIREPLAVINTSYMLAEANYVGNMRGRDLVIADEADTLERELMGFVEFRLTDRRLERLGLHAPKKAVRKKTILAWLEEELEPAVKHQLKLAHGNDIRTIREKKSLEQLLGDTLRIQRDLAIEVQRGIEDSEGAENWVRDNDAGPLVMKPVRVGEYAERVLWGHGDKWLCMSATIISPQEMDESLGVDIGERKSATVSVPMTFPVENRRIEVYPLANVTNKDKEEAWPTLVQGIKVIMDRHPQERILVHTVSYKLAQFLNRELRSSRCLTYTESSQRDRILAEFKRREGAVLLASSMDRGIDLAGDNCRVVIVAKVPFPNLGDRQVSSRLRGPGGQAWYNVQTIRSLVQMTGRGVRSETDWCVTYILDTQFIRKIWREAKFLLPKWWRDAVRIGRTKELGL